MDENSAQTPQQQAFSSDYTRRLIREAELSLGEAIDPARLDEEFAQLAESVDELDEAAFKRLSELTKLLAADPDSLDKMEALKRDGTFGVAVSDDKMSLTLCVKPPIVWGDPVTAEDVLKWIADSQMKCDVDAEALNQAVSTAASGELVRDVVIARGRAIGAAQDEKLELFARPSCDQRLQAVEFSDGRMHDDSPLLCEAGDLILRYTPAKAGEAGHDVYGTVLQPPTLKTRQIGTGRNVRVEGEDYFAEVSGVVSFKYDHLEVRHMLVLTEDVTRRNSPVEFDGHVIIHGAVRNGTEVKASGSITVEGPVEAATIESTAGNVELRHGVAGHHRGVIRADGDVTTRFAENVAIYAGQDIIMGLGSLHSHLLAGRAIRLVRGRGQLIGGSAAAGEVVEAKQIGSVSAVPTEVIIGLSREVMEKLGPVDAEISTIRREHDQVAELADRIERAIGDPTKLTPEELKTYTALRKRQFVGDERLKDLDAQRQQMLEESAKGNSGRVDVHNELMSHVTVHIGQAVLTTDDSRKRCRVAHDADSGQLSIQPLR